MEPTRRDIMGGLAAFAATPLFPAEAGTDAPKVTGANVWGPEVVDRVGAFARLEAPDILRRNVHRLIFKSTAVDRVFQTVTHARFNPLNNSFDEEPGQRFIYCAECKPIGLFFHVVADDDPRDIINGSRPVRVSDLNDALKGIANSHVQYAEISAAGVLNNARVYDPTIGGDGVALCSENHPHETGSWSNTFMVQQDLNETSLREALRRIRNDSVDSMGLRIMNQGRKLVVPIHLQPQAERALAAIKEDFPLMEPDPIVWDYLRAEYAWFILTSIDGLVRYERYPFQLNAAVDVDTDSVKVCSYESVAFTYNDPRAIWGSFPS